MNLITHKYSNIKLRNYKFKWWVIKWVKALYLNVKVGLEDQQLKLLWQNQTKSQKKYHHHLVLPVLTGCHGFQLSLYICFNGILNKLFQTQKCTLLLSQGINNHLKFSSFAPHNLQLIQPNTLTFFPLCSCQLLTSSKTIC